MKKLVMVFLVVALAGAACGGDDDGAEEVSYKACQVTDTGGVDDKSFNASAWAGVHPWLPSPVAPTLLLRSANTRRPPGARTRWASAMPPSRSASFDS